MVYIFVLLLHFFFFLKTILFVCMEKDLWPERKRWMGITEGGWLVVYDGRELGRKKMV